MHQLFFNIFRTFCSDVLNQDVNCNPFFAICSIYSGVIFVSFCFIVFFSAPKQFLGQFQIFTFMHFYAENFVMVVMFYKSDHIIQNYIYAYNKSIKILDTYLKITQRQPIQGYLNVHRYCMDLGGTKIQTGDCSQASQCFFNHETVQKNPNAKKMYYLGYLLQFLFKNGSNLLKLDTRQNGSKGEIYKKFLCQLWLDPISFPLNAKKCIKVFFFCLKISINLTFKVINFNFSNGNHHELTVVHELQQPFFSSTI